MKNNLIIAAAGSGKTTYLVEEALRNKNQRTLITTYTISNEEEIRKKIIKKNNFVPENIIIQTWFSFLIQHGAKPYQFPLFEEKIKGLSFVNKQSGIKYKGKKHPVYYQENNNLRKHYFSTNGNIYSDKLSKFVIRCNQKNNNEVINRISKIFSRIYLDEIQDLAGYDLEIIKLLLQSQSHILMVGDPRQVIYSTHHEKKYNNYLNGKIKEFVIKECKYKNIPCDIDEDSLNVSYRCNQKICDYANRLYPWYNACNSKQNKKTKHDGIFLVNKMDIMKYLNLYNPTQLRLNINTRYINKKFEVYNFGEAKGLTFDRVLIYPTKNMSEWILNNNIKLKEKTRSQFYVAITRAKYSVGIVFDLNEYKNLGCEGITKY